MSTPLTRAQVENRLERLGDSTKYACAPCHIYITELADTDAALREELTTVTQERDRWHQLVQDHCEEDTRFREAAGTDDHSDSHLVESHTEILQRVQQERDLFRASMRERLLDLGEACNREHVLKQQLSTMTQEKDKWAELCASFTQSQHQYLRDMEALKVQLAAVMQEREACQRSNAELLVCGKTKCEPYNELTAKLAEVTQSRDEWKRGWIALNHDSSEQLAEVTLRRSETVAMCEQLQQELTAAQARVQTLEAALKQLANCPDWSLALDLYNRGCAHQDDGYRAAWWKVALIAKQALATPAAEKGTR